MTVVDAPVSRRKLSDEVVERLLRLIESGVVQPGDQLPSERELMGVYRVGRPAVREALQSLQRMGMVNISHGERARVISPTPDTVFDQINRTARHLFSTATDALDHLKEARLMFEQAMVRLAVKKATSEDIVRLQACCDALTRAHHGTTGFIRADMSFHETIASISGNPLFAAISKAMLDWLTHFSVQTVHQPGTENVAISEHLAILDRIAARDEAGAVKAITDHLMRASELYRIHGAAGSRSRRD